VGRRIALLFPGQAAQQVGMGRVAAARFSDARAVFARIDAALDAPISDLCFSGSAAQLQETRWQQPAIFACSLALLQTWLAQQAGADDQVIVAAGHSLGEYSALVAAGALTLEEGARLVSLRGRLMQEAADRTPGGMYAILGLDRARVAAICAACSIADAGAAEMVVLANDNAPGQQVISGGSAALERAAVAAKAQGARRVLPLKVAGAFHSPLMEPAVADLRSAIETTPVQPPAYPVVANSTCALLRDPDAIRAELVRQITTPVRWVESMQAMAGMQPDLWIDTGPGSVMAGLLTRTLAGATYETLSTHIDTEDAA
jgi:[acyl-carrier-protein] S-malonyltransferase